MGSQGGSDDRHIFSKWSDAELKASTHLFTMPAPHNHMALAASCVPADPRCSKQCFRLMCLAVYRSIFRRIAACEATHSFRLTDSTLSQKLPNSVVEQKSRSGDLLVMCPCARAVELSRTCT